MKGRVIQWVALFQVNIMNQLKIQEKSFEERIELELVHLQEDISEASTLATKYGYLNEEYFEEYWNEIYAARAESDYIYDIIDFNDIDPGHDDYLVREEYLNTLMSEGDYVNDYIDRNDKDKFDEVCVEYSLINYNGLAKYLVENNKDNWYNNN